MLNFFAKTTKHAKFGVFALAAVITFSSCASMANSPSSFEQVSGQITQVDKFGNVLTDVKVQDLVSDGYSVGDVVSVKFENGFKFDAPITPGYDVDPGNYLLRTEGGDGYLGICINYGQLAKTAGVAAGDAFTISMKKRAGYLAQLDLRRLDRTYARADYSSDEVFANFREVTVGNIAPGVLYRGSHPTQKDWTRAPYVSALMKKAGIATVINMSDSADKLKKDFASSNPNASAYYRTLFNKGNVVCLDMTASFKDPAYTAKVVEGLRFMINHPAPFYIHCLEGKDRTGFMLILIEALMGATEKEITEDYMLSYVNYYHLTPGSPKYNFVANSNVPPMLKEIAQTDKLKGVNLAEAAKNYLLKSGMKADEIDALQKVLSKK